MIVATKKIMPHGTTPNLHAAVNYIEAKITCMLEETWKNLMEKIRWGSQVWMKIILDRWKNILYLKYELM
jgi:hypothetical protein